MYYKVLKNLYENIQIAYKSSNNRFLTTYLIFIYKVEFYYFS